jgi:hypothetical protein
VAQNAYSPPRIVSQPLTVNGPQLTQLNFKTYFLKLLVKKQFITKVNSKGFVFQQLALIKS